MNEFNILGGGGGRTRVVSVLLALGIEPLTTHPFRDGAPFLPTPNRDTSNIRPLTTFLSCSTCKLFVNPVPFLFHSLWPPSNS